MKKTALHAVSRPQASRRLTPNRRRAQAAPKSGRASPPQSNFGWTEAGIDLEHYAPAYFTFITTKLASGAATAYRKHFGVGIEVWRVLVMLALEEKVSVNMVCKLIGMDKGSVSRCFKTMYEKGFITFSHNPLDGRVRYATLTPAGRQKHDQIKGLALEREREFLSCISPEESEVLIKLLHRLHAHLPNVEKATQAYVAEHVTAHADEADQEQQEGPLR